jgi:hypothetical protein
MIFNVKGIYKNFDAHFWTMAGDIKKNVDKGFKKALESLFRGLGQGDKERHQVTRIF